MRQVWVLPLMVMWFLMGIASPTHAWNKAGHMVMATIAYRDLKQHHPEVIEKVVALLQQHPDFATRWAPRLQNVSEEDRNIVLFMLVARWPDDIRGIAQWDRPKHHFVDFPFVPLGQPDSVAGVDPDPENLLTSLAANRQTLLAAATDSPTTQQKAVVLSWIFHQIGDMHQPLHTITMFTTDYRPPEGDRGGTRFYIRPTVGAHTVSLHKLWDDFILGSENVQTVRNRATELSLRPDLARSTFAELAERDPTAWAKASFTLAKTIVYREGDLAGSTDKQDGELLAEDYLAQCQPLAQR